MPQPPTSQRPQPSIGYPITLKALGLAHKSESGAVKVGLRDAAAVAAAVAAMPAAERYLVEATVTDVVAEVLVAVRRDPPIGWLVSVGFGGVTTEVWSDVDAPARAGDRRRRPVRRWPSCAATRCSPASVGVPPPTSTRWPSLVVTLTDAVVGTDVVEVELNPVLVGRARCSRCRRAVVEAIERGAAMTGFHVELHDGTAVVTIDRPKANAIDAATSKAMGDAFVELDADPAVRAIILTGAGAKFFSAGWDLSAGEEFDSDYGVGGFGGFLELPDRSTPVIAAVNGMAVGGGFEIAMAADLIVAADHAQFWLPEPALGILPDAGA